MNRTSGIKLRRMLVVTALSVTATPAGALAQDQGTPVGSPKLVEQHYETKEIVADGKRQVWKRLIQTYSQKYGHTTTKTVPVTTYEDRYTPNASPYTYPGVPKAGTTYPDSMHKVVTTLSQAHDAGLKATVVTASITGYVKQVFVVGNLQWAGTGDTAKTVRMYLNSLYDGTFNYAGGLSLKNNASRGTTTQLATNDKALLGNILNSGNRSLLDRVPPDGKAFLISEDGEYVGTVDAETAANTLGMSDFLRRSDANGYRLMATTGGSFNGYPVIASQLVSPIALDLNHDGKISVTGKATGFKRFDPDTFFTPEDSVTFDLRGIGKQGRFEWLAGGQDGFLVDDSEGRVTQAAHSDGVLNGNDLFGGQRYDNGYVKLAHLFGTKMLQFASADKAPKLSTRQVKGFVALRGKVLDGLKVWTDANHDGLVKPEELQTLAALGITELGADYEVVSNNKEARMVSYFVQDGQKHMTEDVWFAEDPADFKE